jgi:non-ribosomal peptide synthetase component E (peptide arylation enzyme)
VRATALGFPASNNCVRAAVELKSQERLDSVMLDSLGQVLPHAARAFGDKTALVIGERSFSFHELDDERRQCAIYTA